MWVLFQSQNYDWNLDDGDVIVFVKKLNEWINQFILWKNFTDDVEISR